MHVSELFRSCVDLNLLLELRITTSIEFSHQPLSIGGAQMLVVKEYFASSVEPAGGSCLPPRIDREQILQHRRNLPQRWRCVGPPVGYDKLIGVQYSRLKINLKTKKKKSSQSHIKRYFVVIKNFVFTTANWLQSRYQLKIP